MTLVGADTGSAVQVFDSRNAGARTLSVSSYTISDGNGGANYGPVTTHTAAGSISTRTLTITAVTNTKTYNCTITAAATPTVMGLQDSDTVTGLVEAYTSANAGTGKTLNVTTYTVNDGNAGNNYTVNTVSNNTGVINKAHATINVTLYTVTYNCAAHTAMGTASGCDGDLSSLLNLSGTTHTNAGDYPSDSWSFNSANTNTNYYSESGTVHDNIGKAHAMITVTPYNVVFDSNPHTAIGTATGVCSDNLNALLNLSGTTHTVPGDWPTDPWTFNSANTNTNYFSESGSVHDHIGTWTITGFYQPVDMSQLV